MRVRKCKECQNPIPMERLEALPETETCVACSHVPKVTIREVEIDGADIEDSIKSAVQERY